MIDEKQYFHDRIAQAPPIKWGRFVPFRITFKMGSPVAVTMPWINFDGLIAHLMLLDALGDDFFITPKKLNLTDSLPHNRRLLPIKKTNGIYHASVSIFVPNNLRVTHIYKRFEDRWTDKLKAKKISLGSGKFRSYILAEPYVSCREVIYYVFGDMNIIRNLIEDYLFGLGNDCRIGFGAVRDILFEELDEDLSLTAGGIAMRPIPVEMCEEYEDSAYLAYRAPYWNPKNVALCVPPGARCRLKL